MSKDKKPDMFDLFNDDSLWGNQETDVLTHDDIMDLGWSRKKTQAQKDFQSRVSNERVWGDNSVREKLVKAHLDRWQDPDIRQQYLSSLHDAVWHNKDTHEKRKATLAKTWKDPELIERQKQITIDRWKDPKFVKKAKQAMIKGNNRPEVKARRKQMEKEKWSDLKRKEQILRKAGQVTPIKSINGVFLSLSDAAKAHNMSLGRVRDRLLGKVKSNEYKFKYITWEEYDQLTK